MKKNNDILNRRVEKVLPTKQGLSDLIGKRKIKLYQGFDPTGIHLHLGHTIGLRKLMDFANAGHQVIMLFGTGTVLVGDPSERDSGRKLITQEEIEQNIKDWKKQVAPIVDFEKVTIKQNGDWLTKLSLKDIIRIASKISAVQLFKREMFQRRIGRGDTVWYHETMYPLLQGYDSVVMDVDLEVGGTDQEFNMLIGRELQKKINKKEKYVLTIPMILGTDGQQMSKTSGNCIWLDDSPQDMYGKVMHIPDKMLKDYLELLTDIPLEEIPNLLTNPLQAKKKLAHNITSQFRGSKRADEAQNDFEKTVQKRSFPENIQLAIFPENKITVLKLSNVFGRSNSENKRLIKQGGVELNGKKISNPNQVVEIKDGDIIKFGKREFRKVKIQT